MEALDRLVEIISREGVLDTRVLAAMRKVDRALFVPEASRDRAYLNVPLAIGQGQTISQPLVVGLMTQALALNDGSKVLEVGTGSGYQTAILAELAGQVISVERHAKLAESARELLARLGYGNVRVHTGSGVKGWPDDAPYDRILVTAGAPRIPIHLVARLERNGRLVAPVGSRYEQRLIVLEKGPGGLVEHNLGAVRFVPLIGEGAWDESADDR
ncbi:MAG TPA: protein-L-isoaspartate(D-aspartate) O-methyltransferase [Chloroflexota bacterium]|jgi:protein-L-isoaspartate(D-aspartate) O-methyltransferase